MRLDLKMIETTVMGLVSRKWVQNEAFGDCKKSRQRVNGYLGGMSSSKKVFFQAIQMVGIVLTLVMQGKRHQQ